VKQIITFEDFEKSNHKKKEYPCLYLIFIYNITFMTFNDTICS